MEGAIPFIFSMGFSAARSTCRTPVGAADMTFEHALNADSEPQNWLLHHKNY